MFQRIKKILSQAAGGSQAPKSQLEAVNVEHDEGFVDISLPISRVDRLADGTVVLDVNGMTEGKETGFRIEVFPEWNPVEMEGGLTVYWGEVRFHSLGEVSDRFLAMLASAYGQDPGGYAMANKIDFKAVGLNSDPRDMGVQRQDLKLFFERGADGTYAEVFTNIDLSRGNVEFREKDQDYRLSLLSALTIGNELGLDD